jgi:hypothetical protein
MMFPADQIIEARDCSRMTVSRLWEITPKVMSAMAVIQVRHSLFPVSSAPIPAAPCKQPKACFKAPI